MPHAPSADDLAFARAFDACEVGPEAFDHAAHVRLAYLCEHPVEAAVARMREALLRFLDHLGADRAKYHETTTRAWILAVAHFMAGSPAAVSAAAFVAANPQLLDSKIMLSHYSAEVLFSPRARGSFVEPDVQGIPEPPSG